ncbi:MAG: hypothetical protein ACUVRY_06765 [Thermoanaerobaculaceae bacterium]
MKVTESGTVVRLLLEDALGRRVPGARLSVSGLPRRQAVETPPQSFWLETDSQGEAELSLPAPLTQPLNIKTEVWGCGVFPFAAPPREPEEPEVLGLPVAGHATGTCKLFGVPLGRLGRNPELGAGGDGGSGTTERGDRL